MIDLHAHVVPDFDDGPADLDESLSLFKQYQAQKVTDVVATSHSMPSRTREPETHADLDAYTNRFEKLNQKLKQNQIPVKLHRGFELVLSGDLPIALKRYREQEPHPLTLAGTHYILVELPHWMSMGLDNFEMILFQLQLDGYRPILAHPEHILPFREALPILEQWVHQGSILLQVNAGSIIGQVTRERKRVKSVRARYRHVSDLMERDLVHVIASDAHHSKRRPVLLEAARAAIIKTYGEQRARALFNDNPRRILQDEPMDRMVQ